ncbi:MAG: cohesin domain-containing protein [Gammaproteobacteria bacterium]|jgi:hypothetical protein|nr:cohesin domain-containing protein [Gammaproteobacteria bacterium]
MKKKIMSFSFIMGLFCFISTTPALAISIDFNPTNSSVFVGDAFDVDVVVSGLETGGIDEIVSAYDLFIGYDSAIVAATAVSFGAYLDDVLFPGFTLQAEDLQTAGQINIAETSLLTDEDLLALQQPDSFTLATLSFTALSAGISDLLFDLHPLLGINNDVKGRNGALIPVAMGTGTISVASKPISVPEPGTLALLLAGLLIFSVSSRSISFKS